MPAATDTATNLIQQAADHLSTAADLAAQAATPAAEAFAAQILLVRAALGPTYPPDDDTASDTHTPTTVVGLLEVALDTLDLIEPLIGPADLPVCAWHVAELARLARAGCAS